MEEYTKVPPFTDNTSPKDHKSDHGNAVTIVALLCGITLVIVLIFAVKRGNQAAKLSDAQEQVIRLTEENETLKEENESLQKQIDTLQEEYNEAKDSLRKAKKKADTYDDLVDAFSDLLDALDITLPDNELKMGYGY